MKAIVVMFDSLNRGFLGPYNSEVKNTPNFDRLAARTATFDTSYVSSMPCMPARRDFFTGRQSFLHRSWGPLEPFDQCLPELLKDEGVWTHLTTDHHHYFEEGGANYHCKFNSWEFSRGQEGDPWIGAVAAPSIPENTIDFQAGKSPLQIQDWKNRSTVRSDADMPISKTFASGIEFLERNKDEDNWFLQIETFDPHEPFFSLEEHKTSSPSHYDKYDGPIFDWPPYRDVREAPDLVEHARAEYASLVGLCDQKLGKVLDFMDANEMWEDTMLIVWTDHGFLLGEHGSWAKVWTPFYEEVARTPFFVWDPRNRVAGERRNALVQPALDLAPTLLNYFGLDVPDSMQGKNLEDALVLDKPIRETALFGVHGMHVNMADGRHVYMRGPDIESPVYEYTLMPAHMHEPFATEDLGDSMSLVGPLSFTQSCQVLKIPAIRSPYRFDLNNIDLETRYYDLEKDPNQFERLKGDKVEAHLENLLKAALVEAGAPGELFDRLSIDIDLKK
ncbi:sulfatase [Puniceicoccaceae bacterium K14]|nr:sulfatase [Puniceicoccaceae bacterium K14]